MKSLLKGSSIFLFALLFLFASCSKNGGSDAPKQYRIGGRIAVDGLNRTYTLVLPPNYYEAGDFSLVIALHGGGGSGTQFETSSKLSEKASVAKFIVVYPDGVQSDGLLKARTWNAGGCCAYARDNKIDDVKFMSNLIDALVSNYKINVKKVYATGHSNGGMMAYRLACELPNKIAAIAPNACTLMVTQPCNPGRPVPVLHMHSVLDNNVPVNGGVGTGPTQDYFHPVDSTLNVWSTINACGNKAQVVVDNDQYTLTQWTNCSNAVTIQYYLTQDGGHAWPGGLPGSVMGDKPSIVINADDLLWDFFQQYQLP